MKKTITLLLSLLMLVSVIAVPQATVAGAAYANGSVDTAEYIGNVTVTHFNDVWGSSSPTNNTVRIITPGTSITGAYYEKIYAKYNATGGYYEVVKKVANHRSYTQSVQTGYIGILFSYAPLVSAGSSLAKESWKVWQHIREGDRLYLKNIDLTNKTLSTSGTWGYNSYTSNSYIEVETVNPVYPTVTPYSNKKIVAQGDSITVGGGWTSTWSDYFSTTVINSGFGGDTSWASLSARYDSFVAVHNPEIVIVSFGINDAFSEAPSTSLMEKYKTALRGIYDRNTALGAVTVFMTANVIDLSTIKNGGVFDKGDYSAFGGEEAYLDKFIDCMRQVAAEKGCVVIDLYTMWKNEGLSPDALIDSCHPDDTGYNMNWTVQKPALIKNMKTICGDDIRMVAGTTADKVVAGMPDCTVTIKDASGNSVASTAVMQNGYKVSYTYVENGTSYNLGTYTVKIIEHDRALISKNAPFSVRNNVINCSTAITAADITNNIFNVSVTVKNSAGKVLSGSTSVGPNSTVTVKNSENGTTIATYTVKGDKLVESTESFELIDNSSFKLDDTYLTINAIGTSAATIAAQFNCTVSIYTASGTKLANTEIAGTGCVVKYLGTNGEVLDSAEVVLNGDLNGDGAIATVDLVIAEKALSGSSTLKGAINAASDLNGDGTMSASDIVMIENFILS
ncbi:MAG: hypothetical protein IJB76_07720 [Clostridia bacterium]|nr:hypothetical protein [Clostridia bacterium]